MTSQNKTIRKVTITFVIKNNWGHTCSGEFEATYIYRGKTRKQAIEMAKAEATEWFAEDAELYAGEGEDWSLFPVGIKVLKKSAA